MQCTACGLQWTMTVHRIAQLARQKAAAADAHPNDRVIAHIWADWASSLVEEQRGRRKAGRSDVEAKRA
jgi:hypothetical protein